jgi:hypothetical protein
VRHGISATNPGLGHNCTATNNPTYTLTNPVIDPAILALDHSFSVDNLNRGSSPGTGSNKGSLTVDRRDRPGRPRRRRHRHRHHWLPQELLLRRPSREHPAAVPVRHLELGWYTSRETLCAMGSTATGSGCAATS